MVQSLGSLHSSGFKLSHMIAEGVSANPKAELVLMEKHGLVTWGETSEAAYAQTIKIISEAEAYIEARVQEDKVFGGLKHQALPAEVRGGIAAQIMPAIRGAVSVRKNMILSFDDGDDVLQFVGCQNAHALSQVGAACPDQLVHTKVVPLFIDWTPSADDLDGLKARLKEGIAAYEASYTAYFERNMNDGDVMFDAAPRVILIPGVGMINTGKNWAMSRVSGALYHRAIAVMRGAAMLGEFVSLSENESYQVEYWPLELYKLSLAPRKWNSLARWLSSPAGRVALAAKRLDVLHLKGRMSSWRI